MVENLEERLKARLDVGEVNDPSHLLIDFLTYMNLDAVRMPVEPRALVPRRHLRKSVSRFKRELLENFQDDSSFPCARRARDPKAAASDDP
jgi:hypothetical protein